MLNSRVSLHAGKGKFKGWSPRETRQISWWCRSKNLLGLGRRPRRLGFLSLLGWEDPLEKVLVTHLVLPESPMDRGAFAWVAVCGVPESARDLRDCTQSSA